VTHCVSELLLLLYRLVGCNIAGSLTQLYHLVWQQTLQQTTGVYLNVSVSTFLTLFSARTSDKFFFQIRPAGILFVGGVFSLTLSSILAVFWPETELDGILTEGLQSDIGIFGFIWIFCLVVWLIQDLLKVMTYRWMYAVNFNNIRKSGVVELPDSAKKLLADLEDAM
jgi:H+-transporting ATPase